MPRTHDIAVLGATAAGYVAGITLSKKGHDVIVLTAPGSAVESPLADWIPSDVFKVCPALRAVRSAGTDRAFRQVQFHSGDLTQQAAYRSRSTAGYVLRSARLLEALRSAAAAGGVRRAQFQLAPEVELQETAVILRERPVPQAGGPRLKPRRQVRAKLLLIAQDSPAQVVGGLGLPVRSVPVGRLSACGLDAPVSGSGPDGALHVVSYPNHERLGMFFAARGIVHVRVLSTVASAPAGADDLGELIGRLRRGGLLPAKMNLTKAAAASWRPPGGVALELETHLAKRTLLIGTAGGFASAMTGQTLDASVRSALAAAEVAAEALKSRQCQDTLAAYKGKWRDELADRIRAPGASLRMLLPIVFSNKAMATRCARAILYGESI